MNGLRPKRCPACKLFSFLRGASERQYCAAVVAAFSGAAYHQCLRSHRSNLCGYRRGDYPKLAKEERLPIGYQHGEAVTVTLERQDRITLQAESVADDDSVSGEQNHSCSGCISLQGQSVAAGYLGERNFMAAL